MTSLSEYHRHVLSYGLIIYSIEEELDFMQATCGQDRMGCMHTKRRRHLSKVDGLLLSQHSTDMIVGELIFFSGRILTVTNWDLRRRPCTRPSDDLRCPGEQE